MWEFILKESLEKDECDLLEEVNDQLSFLRFVQAMIINRKECEVKTENEVGFVCDWANNSIFDFLDSASAWAESSNFGISQEPEIEGNPWKQFATFLYCGKVYE